MKMKKTLALFIAVLLIVSCFSFAVSAETTIRPKCNICASFESGCGCDYTFIESEKAVITFEDNYTIMKCGSYDYSRFNDANIYFDNEYAVRNNIVLTKEQSYEISAIYLSSTESGSIVWAEFEFLDGSTTTATFKNQDVWSEKEALDADNVTEYTIDFEYPIDNVLEVKKSEIKENVSTLEFCPDDYTYFYVKAYSSDKSFYIEKGVLVTYRGDYYFLDYQENGIITSFTSLNNREYMVHKITNEKLIEKIDEHTDEFYGGDFGFLFDDSFTETVSNVFLIMVFFVLPLLAFITFLILTIRAKKKIYKRAFAVIDILTALEMIIFVIIALIITL